MPLFCDRRPSEKTRYDYYRNTSFMNAVIEERKQQDPECYYFGHGSTNSLDNIFGNRNTITSDIFTDGTASDVIWQPVCDKYYLQGYGCRATSSLNNTCARVGIWIQLHQENTGAHGYLCSSLVIDRESGLLWTVPFSRLDTIFPGIGLPVLWRTTSKSGTPVLQFRILKVPSVMPFGKQDKYSARMDLRCLWNRFPQEWIYSIFETDTISARMDLQYLWSGYRPAIFAGIKLRSQSRIQCFKGDSISTGIYRPGLCTTALEPGIRLFQGRGQDCTRCFSRDRHCGKGRTVARRPWSDKVSTLSTRQKITAGSSASSYVYCYQQPWPTAKVTGKVR